MRRVSVITFDRRRRRACVCEMCVTGKQHVDAGSRIIEQIKNHRTEQSTTEEQQKAIVSQFANHNMMDTVPRIDVSSKAPPEGILNPARVREEKLAV